MKKSNVATALALMAEVFLMTATPAFAGSYTVPPFGGYVLVYNSNGKASSTSGLFTTTNGYLCPCTGVDSTGKVCNKYETGDVREYKYVSVYAGPGTVSVSYTLKVYEGTLTAESGSSNIADIVVTLGIWDSTGSNLGFSTILSKTVTGANGITQYQFGSPSTYTGSTGWSVTGDATYTIRWTVEVYSQNNAQSDFYYPFWVSLSATITTPQGQGPPP